MGLKIIIDSELGIPKFEYLILGFVSTKIMPKFFKIMPRSFHLFGRKLCFFQVGYLLYVVQRLINFCCPFQEQVKLQNS